MIPSAFVFLDDLPLSANGKVDRSALPAPDLTKPGLDSEYEEPRNQVEATVADIWSQVLGLSRIGIHENFLELGGDSLFAVQVAAHVFDTYGVEMSLEQVFDRPTIAEMAERIADEGRTGMSVNA
jgi:acyl carrier protein